MSSKVTIAVAADITDADDIQARLRRAGIESTLEPAESGLTAPVGDGPARVLVDADRVEAATDALAAAAMEDDEEIDYRP